jgi:hypothetical protein
MISVDKPLWHSLGQASEQSDRLRNSESSDLETELPLHLGFDFVRTTFDKAGNRLGDELSCQPVEFSNTVGSKRLHDAWTVINAHPEWTDDQDLEAARKFGMRYGAEQKAELLRTLPLKELGSIYGPLQVTDAEFKVTSGLKEPETSFALLYWFITAKRVGTPKTLQIMVEPFHGKIIGISQ